MHVCLCMCVTVCVHLWIGVRRIHVKCAVQCVCGQSEHHFEFAIVIVVRGGMFIALCNKGLESFNIQTLDFENTHFYQQPSATNHKRIHSHMWTHPFSHTHTCT